MTEPVNAKRITSVEPDGEGAPDGRRPFARIAASRVVRRLAVGRLAAGVAGGAVLLGLLAVGGSRALETAVAWLHGRPERLLPFAEITLRPEPPPWVRTGAAGLLAQVRTRSRRPEVLRVHDLDLARLAEDFQRESPWVRGVREIERSYPNRLTIALEYRRPAAIVRSKDPGNPTIYLDRDGVVLPADDLDPGAAGRLIRLSALGPPGAVITPLAGLVLRVEPVSGDWDGIPPNQAQRAARLAGFFLDREGQGRPDEPAVVVEAIHGAPAPGLWVQLAGQKLVRWGPAPGFEEPGEPTSAEKWAWLTEWMAGNRGALAALRYPAYLAFDGGRVVVREGK